MVYFDALELRGLLHTHTHFFGRCSRVGSQGGRWLHLLGSQGKAAAKLFLKVLRRLAADWRITIILTEKLCTLHPSNSRGC